MKKIYFLLIAGVFILLTVSAILTIKLVDVELPAAKPAPALSQDNTPPDISSISETRIEAKAPLPVSDITPQNWRTPRKQLKTVTIPPEPSSEQVGIGKATSVSGETFISLPGKKRTTLDANMRISQQSKIETGPNSYIQITFDDNSTISIAENSALIVDEYIYNPHKAEENNMSIRFVKGMCRIFTGMITNLNPERFLVRSRMTSIGIRGCEVAISSDSIHDTVYILDVSDGKTIVVDTTSNGNPLSNPSTEESFYVDDSIRQTIIVSESAQLIALNQGQKPKQRSMTPTEIREIQEQTSHMSPAKYDIQDQRGGIKLRFQKTNDTKNSGSNKGA